MGRPTMFTVRRRELILELLRAGASRRAAARAAGVHHTTLVKWLRRGEHARHPESQYALFREEVIEAEANPAMRALRETYDRISDNPDLAWRYVERQPEYVSGGDDPDDDPDGGSVITLRLDG